MSIFARWHRRRLAEKHWNEVKISLPAFREPLDIDMIARRHLDHASRPTGNGWDFTWKRRE